jgi:hypothetical protein
MRGLGNEASLVDRAVRRRIYCYESALQSRLKMALLENHTKKFVAPQRTAPLPRLPLRNCPRIFAFTFLTLLERTPTRSLR